MKTAITDDTECPTYLWEKAPVHITERTIVGELCPSSIHVIPKGSVNDDPSFLFVLDVPAPGVGFIAQLSFEKLWPAMEAAIKLKAKS